MYSVLRAAQLVDQRERRASEIVGGPPPAPDALREARLARAQIALEANHFAAAQQLAQPLAKARSLSSTAADKFDHVGIKNRHAEIFLSKCVEIIPRFGLSEGPQQLWESKFGIQKSEMDLGSQSG
jgi:hypothetical protein